jgi:hypothetical protein
MIRKLTFVAQHARSLAIKSFCGCDKHQLLPRPVDLANFDRLAFLDIDFYSFLRKRNAAVEHSLLNNMKHRYPNLERLHLHNCEQPFWSLVGMLANLPKLRHVALSSSLNITEDELACFEEGVQSKISILQVSIMVTVN